MCSEVLITRLAGATRLAKPGRTPASIRCLKNFQSDLPSMLYDSIFAITITVATAIAFVDMVSSFDKRIP